MITEPTVFVLGAGASAPYRFPIGSGLKDTILNGLANDLERSLYTSSGFANEQLQHFERVLRISPYDTIDAILSFRPSIAPIGKFAIVKTLSVCQQHGHVFPPKDWYHYFFRRLELDNPAVPAPPLTVLTFNYDNSLEYFFETIIDEMYEGKHQAAIRKKFESIKIIHLHGRLGPFPADGDDPLSHLSRSLDQSDIRVISDAALDKAQEFVDAFTALSSASRIAFLGFGYAELNLRRLRLHDLDGKAKIYGTCLNMNAESIKKVVGRDILLCNNLYPCLNALQEWKELI